MTLHIDPEPIRPIPTSEVDALPPRDEGSATGPSSKDEGLGAWAASLALKGIEKATDRIRAVGALFKKVGGKSAAEVERLRTINLAAVEVWETYNKEGERVENDNATGVLGHTVGFIDSLLRDDGETIHHDRAEKWALRRALVAEVKKTIAAGSADTLREALTLIRYDGPLYLRGPAKRFLEEKLEHGHSKGYPLWELVDFAARPDRDSATAHELIERAFELEYDADAVETPFAVYSFVHAVSTDPTVKKKAEEGMKALSGESGFGRAAMKFVFSSSPEGAALDVGLMFASAGLGNLAKLSTLSKLEKAGVTGYKAVALGKAAEVGAETTALWALNAGKEAATHDVGKALDPKHLAKGFAATGLMIGFLKVFGAAGEGIAEKLGFVAKGAGDAAKLPFWKKAAGSAIGHGAGLTGMIVSTKAGEALNLHDAPVGGANESLVDDLFGYVRFALAHKAVDRLLGGKLSEISLRLHAKTAAMEAKVNIDRAIDDLLATSPRLPDKAREAIRNDLLAKAALTGRLPTRVGDVLPLILETFAKTEAPKNTAESYGVEREVPLEVRDEDIVLAENIPDFDARDSDAFVPVPLPDAGPAGAKRPFIDSALKARTEVVIKEGPERGCAVGIERLLEMTEERAKASGADPDVLIAIETLKKALPGEGLEPNEIREILSILDNPELRKFVPEYLSPLSNPPHLKILRDRPSPLPEAPKVVHVPELPDLPMAARVGVEHVKIETRLRSDDSAVTRNIRVPEMASLGAMAILSPELLNAPLWMQIVGFGFMAGMALWPKVKGWMGSGGAGRIDIAGLGEGEWFLGRHREGEVHRDVIPIGNPVVSRKHAKIIVRPDGSKWLMDMTADTKRLRKEMGMARSMDTAAHGTWIKEGPDWRKLRPGEMYELRPGTEMALGTIVYGGFDSAAARRHRPGDPVPVRHAEINAFEYTMEATPSAEMPAAAYLGDPIAARPKMEASPPRVLELLSKEGSKRYKLNPAITLGGKVAVDRVMAERMTRMPSAPERIRLYLRSLHGKRYTTELGLEEAVALKFLTRDADGNVHLRPEADQPGYWLTPYFVSE